jgi:type IV fimbrial biogenesis protein FimT
MSRKSSALSHVTKGNELKKTLGFSLIEVMIVIAVVAVLGTLATPLFSDLIRNNRMRAQVGDLMGHLAQARTEALRAGARVTLCPGSTSGCSGSAWESGWIGFIDSNSNASLDAGETTILSAPALSGGNTLRSSDFASSISFRHDGASVSIAGQGQAGVFALCDSRGFGDKARAVKISITGRTKVMQANANGSEISNCGT